jgi:hypothetical protein
MNERELRNANKRVTEENVRLTKECQRLRLENADLRSLLKSYVKASARHGIIFPTAWGLAAQEAAVLSLVVEYGDVDYDQICSVLWGRADGGVGHRRSLQVVTFRIRRKIGYLGVLRTVHAKGLSMSETDRARIRAACEENWP